MIGTEFEVNHKIVRGFIHPPTPMEEQKARQDFLREMNSFDLFATKPMPFGGSEFRGFAVRAAKLQAVHLAYCKVRTAVPSACHIMCAYNVAGMADSCDDGEHYGGLQMSKFLEQSSIKNVAIFVARQCGPNRIGGKRFEIIRALTHELFQIMDQSTMKDPIDVRWGARPPAPITAEADVQT